MSETRGPLLTAKTVQEILAYLRAPENQLKCIECGHELKCEKWMWHFKNPGMNQFSHGEPCHVQGCECGWLVHCLE